MSGNFLKMLDYSAEELIGKSARILYESAEEFERVGQAKYMAIAERGTGEVETRWKRKDGSVIDILLSSTPIDPSDLSAGVTFTAMDITERKRAENALRESDRMKTEFVRTAAHEFRTPLTSIQGFSQLLLTRADLSPEEQREFLSYIYERSVALADIVAALLDISRIETGQGLALSLAPCPVTEVFRQVEPFLKTQATKHRLEVALAGKNALLNVDKGKVGEVLENLLSNAVKFSAAGSLILIRGDLVEGGYRVSIADQGIGMTPDQAAKVFDKFYRADASHTAAEGIGLGMSIVQHIVEGHGGRIWVESALGKGTTVSFTIPLSRMTEQEEAETKRR